MIDFDKLINTRRDLHKIPELGNNEYKTIKYIKYFLNKENISWKSVTKTGILAEVYGKNPGKCVLIRADIDALPIFEENDIPYKSEHNGIMHACGHDSHIAVALFILKYFNDNKDKLFGIIKVAFQPDEEGYGGAERMINLGVLNNPKVDYALSIHVEPQYKTGTVSVKSGTVMASPDNFRIKIIGSGGHGGNPENCINPITVASELLQKLELSLKKDLGDEFPCTVSVCGIQAGTSYNIIPNFIEIFGTARSLNNKTRDKVEKLLKIYSEKICSENNCNYEYEFTRLYPPVINNEFVSKIVAESVKECNYNLIIPNKSSMLGDDFSYFANEIPSCYFKIGCSNDKNSYPLHNSRFNIDENCLEIAFKVLMKSIDKLTKL